MKPFPALFSNLKSAGSHGLHPSPQTLKPTLPSWNSILLNLLHCNQIDEARHVFSQIPSPDLRLCTMMINAYSRNNRIHDALNLFDHMPHRDAASWNSIIKGCLDCGELALAQRVFDEMPEKNVISWTTIVDGLARFGRVDAAEDLFWTMPKKDSAAWNSMISGYCCNERVHDARLLFEKMPLRNVISWTAMISGYDQNGESDVALRLFCKMCASNVQPTASTFACVLTACANVLDLCLGMQLHSYLVKASYLCNTYVSTSLVTMYACCEQIDSSHQLFYENGHRNVASWTALITGYGLNGRHFDALDEFQKMILHGITPNQSTFTSALNSCCGIEALDRGRKIHAKATKHGFDIDVFVGNSLVVLYSKCGAISDGLKVFDNMEERNLVSWNSVIMGCAQNGYALDALRYFDYMVYHDVQPDEITFTGLLTACSHSRMLDKARQVFQRLREDPLVNMKLEHYVCMVDVLGRCGQLDEAEELIKHMPMKPNATVWLALLSACRVHLNMQVARRTAQTIFDLEPHNSAAYVLLSNIYASAGRWNDVSQIRVMMRCRGITKVPGYSWITVKESRHEFVCGDRTHPMSKEIFKKLEWLSGKLKECGFEPDKRFALHDVDDEQKEAALAYHSEKLAVAFGLLSTVEGSTIRVMKNLRVCGDCHSAIKMISKIVEREIVLRDSSRFHHMRDGCCSCGDCW
ncbi:putative tetratricopeptide-like helical domain superfamily, DYW domain-containing protein [Dioscorea sansibarensis]